MTHPTDSPSLTDLNNDCLRHVLLHLPITDRIRLRTVCKRFRRMSDDCWRSVKNLTILDPTNFAPTEFENKNGIAGDEIDQMGESLSGINNHIILSPYSLPHLNQKLIKGVMQRCGEFITCLNALCEDMSCSVVSTATKHCHRLEFLGTHVTSEIDDEQLKELFPLNKKLKALDLVVSFENVKACFRTMPYEFLEKLGVEARYMNPPPSMMMSLKKIIHKGQAFRAMKFNFVDDEMVGIIGDKTELEVLQLFPVDASELTERGLRPILKLGNLRRLAIIALVSADFVRVHPPIDDDFLTALAENLQLLERIAIGAPYITDEGFAKLAHLPKLKKLSILEGRHVTDKHLALFHQLEIFGLIDCNIHDEGVIKLLEKSQCLRQLLLEGSHITNKTLIAAVRTTGNRRNGLSLDLFNGDTDSDEMQLTERSSLLHIVNRWSSGAESVPFFMY